MLASINVEPTYEYSLNDDMMDDKSCIMMISMTIHKIEDLDYTDEHIFIYDPSDRINGFRKGAAKYCTEQLMISGFLSVIKLIQPMIIIGWNFDFDYNFIDKRAIKFNIDISYIDSIKRIDIWEHAKKRFLYGPVTSVAGSLGIYDNINSSIFKISTDPMENSIWVCTLFKKIFDKLNIIKELNLKVVELVKEPTDETLLVVEI